MTVRLVVSDIDGTLVRTDKSLSDANVAAVGRLARAGVPMTLVSARPPSGMRWIADRLDLPGPFAAFNGGVLFDRAGKVIASHRLDPDLATTLFALFVEAGVMRWLFADGDWLTNAIDTVRTPREIMSAGLDPILTENVTQRLGRVDKLVAVSDDDALLTKIEARARQIAGDRATIARSQPYYLDVTAPAANKGDAVAALARLAGVALADIAVMGDQDNDLPMFARAGYAVAMGQASAHVKAMADDVSASNDDDGVADAIDRLLLPQVVVSGQTR